MMLIDNQFEIGDYVYLKTDPDQYRRQVISIHVNPGDISYTVQCGEVESCHFAMELSDEKDVTIMMTDA